jgi:hypothetical protein
MVQVSHNPMLIGTISFCKGDILLDGIPVIPLTSYFCDIRDHHIPSYINSILAAALLYLLCSLFRLAL